MALLDRIEKMKQTGLSDSQVSDTLMQEGISPREINDALGQAKIKSAIYPKDEQAQDMQPSIMDQELNSAQGNNAQQNQYNGQQPYYTDIPQNQQTAYPPQQSPYGAQQNQYANQQSYYADPNQQPYPNQAYAEGYDPQVYAQDPNYDPNQQYAQGDSQVYYQQAIDMETVRDVARQEIEDNLKKVKQDIDSLSKIKTELKFEIQNMDNRLARIESVIQELQSAIIRKMGEYGEAISGISEEVKATQNSFSKMINPIMDKKRNYSEQNNENNQEQQEQIKKAEIQAQKQFNQKKAQENQNRPRPKADSKASVEDYFR